MKINYPIIKSSGIILLWFSLEEHKWQDSGSMLFHRCNLSLDKNTKSLLRSTCTYFSVCLYSGSDHFNSLAFGNTRSAGSCEKLWLLPGIFLTAAPLPQRDEGILSSSLWLQVGLVRFLLYTSAGLSHSCTLFLRKIWS